MNDDKLVSSPGNTTPHRPGWASGASTEATSDNLDDAAFQNAVNAPYQPSAQPIPMDRTSSAITSANLQNRFTYHPPKSDQPERYERLRAKALELASLILEVSNTSREQSLALHYVEQAVMWANAGIARNE